MQQLKIYRMKINNNVDLELTGEKPDDSTESIGMYRIADIANPAVLTKGMFFSNDGDLEVLDKNKVMLFSNDLKFRMAAPLAIPNLLIERNDDSGKYFVYFSEEDIEDLYFKFMKNLKTTNIFQKNHTDVKSDSFLFESILLDSDAKVNMVKEDYGIEVPKGSIVMVQQYMNQDSYFEAVSKGRNGLSLEGVFDLLDVSNEVSVREEKFEEQTINKNKTNKNMKKVIINDKFVLFEGVEVGSKVYNVEDRTELLTFETDEQKVVDGVIVEVKEDEKPKETELETEVEKPEEDAEKAKETELEVEATPDVEDKVEDVVKETGLTEAQVLALIQPKLDELYEALAKLKSEGLTPTVQNFSAQTSSKVDTNGVQSRLNNITGSTAVKVKVENK